MLLVVGVVVRPHGVRGEVVVDVRTDDPGDRFAVGSVLLTDRTDVGPLTVESVRPHTSGGRLRLLVAFEEIQDRNRAEALRGVALQVESDDLPATDDPDEFHDHELIGLSAVDDAGTLLGEVIRVDHVPANDLLVLRRPDGREALVPFVKAIVPKVDVPGGTVVVNPPPGLLEL